MATSVALDPWRHAVAGFLPVGLIYEIICDARWACWNKDHNLGEKRMCAKAD